jgi:hypothetical protein
LRSIKWAGYGCPGKKRYERREHPKRINKDEDENKGGDRVRVSPFLFLEYFISLFQIMFIIIYLYHKTV